MPRCDWTEEDGIFFPSHQSEKQSKALWTANKQTKTKLHSVIGGFGVSLQSMETPASSKLYLVIILEICFYFAKRCDGNTASVFFFYRMWRERREKTSACDDDVTAAVSGGGHLGLTVK